MLQPEPNLPSTLRRDSTEHPLGDRTARAARRAVAVLALAAAASANACGGVRLRSPIQTGPEPAGQPASGPPQTFIRSTSDAKSARLIDIREGMKKDVLFKTVSDLLDVKYSIDVSDPNAGFLMTTWQTGMVRDGVPDLRYRTRIIVRFLGENWSQVAVRAEANWQRGDGDEWDVGYDVGQLEAVAAELRTGVGKKTN